MNYLKCPDIVLYSNFISTSPQNGSSPKFRLWISHFVKPWQCCISSSLDSNSIWPHFFATNIGALMMKRYLVF